MAQAESEKATMMTMPKPQKEHAWLRRLAGEWEYEGEAMMPGQPPMRHSGTETVRAMGDFWIVREAEASIPGGQKARTLVALGFDPFLGRFVGSFIDTTSPLMWVYEGDLDQEGNMLTLNTEGPSMVEPGKTALFRDSIEIQDDDHHLFTSEMLGDDGKWHQLMTSNYRRR